MKRFVFTLCAFAIVATFATASLAQTPESMMASIVEIHIKPGAQAARLEAIPVSVGILVDAGAEAIECVELVLDNLDATDEVFVVSFGRTTGIVHEMSTDTADIPAAIGRGFPGGRSTLYPALELALERLDAARHQRRAIILLTNGQIVGGDLARSREAIRESDVIVYGVGMPRPPVADTTGADVAVSSPPTTSGRSSNLARRHTATIVAEVALKAFADDSGGVYGVVPLVRNRSSNFVEQVCQAIVEHLKPR